MPGERLAPLFTRLLERSRIHPYLPMPATTENIDRPIACDMSALDDPEAHEEVGRRLLSNHTEIREIDDGYALKFPGFEWAKPILEFIVGERQCCPFYTFELVVQPDDGAVWLRFRGDEDVKAYTSGWIRELKDEHGGDVGSFSDSWKENHG